MLDQLDLMLSFDDVQLPPRYSTIPSRFDASIDLTTKLLPNMDPIYPIISANMDTVTHWKMSSAMHECGCLGIIHRFMTIEQHRVALFSAASKPTVVCIGLGLKGQMRLTETIDIATAVLIDVAHGHCKGVIDQITWCKKAYPKLPIIAGNIATYEAAADLIEAGANCLKVGVGPGSLCTTRIHTAAGVPQLSAIMDVVRCCNNAKKGTTVIADGGIRSSGDIIKALAAGAHAIMTGNLLAGTDEAPGERRVEPDGRMYKVYRGMASRDAQEDWKGAAQSIEGEVKRVPYKGPVSEIITNLRNQIRSGMAYQNARSIRELQTNAKFIRQTPAGYQESQPHGL